MNIKTSSNLGYQPLVSRVKSAGKTPRETIIGFNHFARAHRLLRGLAVMLTAALFVLLATNTLASLIAYEPFNYPVGAFNAPASTATGTPTTTTGGGFSGWFSGGAGASIVSGFTSPNLPTANNALQWGSSVNYEGENLAAPILPGTTAAVFVSFLYQTAAYSAGHSGFAMDNGAGANGGLYLGMTSSGVFGVAAGDAAGGSPAVTTTPTSAGTLNMAFNATYFVVVEFDKDSAGTYYQSGNIWINPAPGASAPATSGTFTGTYATANKIADFLALSSNAQIDELRIGTTYADVTPANASAPAVPAGLTATPGANQVALSWADSAGTTTSYNIKRSTTTGTEVTIATVNEPTVTYTDTTAAGGTTYFYVVSAVNPTGESANSAEKFATPTIGLPSAPTGLTATAGDSQVSLSWTAGLAASGYNVLRSTTSGAESLLTTVGTTSYTDTTAVNGTTYYYEVVSTNTAGSSVASSEVSATPQSYTGVYEPFNYTLGTFADGTASTGSGLTGNWTVGNGTIISGLTYPSLPSGKNAISTTGSRDQVALATPFSSGTKYVSFLFNQLGDNGGNLNGLVLFGNGATSLIVGLTAPYSGTAGSLGLGAIATAGAGATGITTFSGQQITGGFNYSQTHLVVVRIDFNTSGANDTVSVWLDPVAGTNAPSSAANLVWSAYDVGTITGIGFNTQGGGNADEYDEIRTGNTYGSVAGGAGATIPTTLGLSVAASKLVSWTPLVGTDYFQPQSSSDNVTWNNLGGLLTGSAVTSVTDPAPPSPAYYQVLEIAPAVSDAVANGNFEFGNAIDGAAYWNNAGNAPPTWITTDNHTPSGTACMDLNVPAESSTSEINQDVQASGNTIVGGNSYNFSFWAKQISAGVSYVANYKITWYDAGANNIGTVGWTAFTGGSGSWAQISTGPITAPANAVDAFIEIYDAVGAVTGASGEVYIDDVSLTTTTATGTTNVLAPTVQSGVLFTATVQTNGVTAGAATGTVSFQTNSMFQSSGAVTGGIANSTVATVPASYTVIAIYSGDGFYIGSTNTLVVGGSNYGSGKGSVSLAGGISTVVMSGLSGNNYILQRATNVTFTAGISNFPVVTAPASGNVTNLDNFSDLGGVPKAAYYRLHYVR
jgi:hypothetical protein